MTSARAFASALLLPIVVGCATVAPSAVQQGSTDKPYARAALSGTKQKLDFSYSIHPDCTLYGYPTVRTLTPPAHGAVTIEQGTDYTNFAKDNQRYACNLHPSPGVLTYYQSEAGYTGPDLAIVEAIFPGGTSRTYTFNITVK